MKKLSLQSNLSIIFNYARNYAEGDRYDLEICDKAIKDIDKEIKKLEEYKWKYKELEK